MPADVPAATEHLRERASAELAARLPDRLAWIHGHDVFATRPEHSYAR